MYLHFLKESFQLIQKKLVPLQPIFTVEAQSSGDTMSSALRKPFKIFKNVRNCRN